MELRVLKYFLAVAREQSISAAADALHLSQPTLSRQLKELEEELGKPLLIRGARQITLTEEGMILRKRAEEILSLADKAVEEVSQSGEDVSGNVYIGAGETDAFHYLARAIAQVQQKYPNIRFHISSGDTSDVMDDLDRGLIDFGLLFGPANTQRFETWRLSGTNGPCSCAGTVPWPAKIRSHPVTCGTSPSSQTAISGRATFS